MDNNYKKKKRKESLIGKFTIIVCVSLSITIFFLSLYYIFTEVTIMKQNHLEKENYLDTLSSIIISTYISNKKDFKDLNTISNNLTARGVLVYVNVISKKDNKIVWSNIKELNGLKIESGNVLLSQKFKQILKHVDFTKLRQVKKDFDDSTLYIAFYNNDMTFKLVNIFIKGNLTLAFIFIILGIASSIVLARNVIKPVQILVNGAEEFSKGNLKHRAIISTHDEIGDLANAFNGMAEKLDVLYTSLEKQVEERTNELILKNEEVERAYKDLKEAQAMMIHNEKMTSLGQLVAGIAHEINNPINFIYGNLAHLKNYSNDLIEIISTYDEMNTCLDEEQKDKISKIKEEIDYEFIVDDLMSLIKSCRDGAERCKQIVIDLRNFSRLDEAMIKEIDIHEGIDSTLNILHNKYKNRINIHKQYGELPLFPCYAGQINQVFMNILDNASQAIKGEGNLTIATKVENGKLVLSFEDDGEGIDNENLNKVFDPFFTTKPVGEGTGLGLSISYKVIKSHGGNIRAESEKGKGTKFIIEIPLDWHENVTNKGVIG